MSISPVGDLIRDRMPPRTQQTLARQLGVSRQTVSQLINNHCRVTAKMAVKLAKHLGHTPAWWMDRQRDIDLQRVK